MTDTTTPVGTQGAKRQSQKAASPRALLRRMMDDLTGASEAIIRTKFTRAVINDPDMLDAIIEYWFANNYRNLSDHDDAPIERLSSQEAQQRKKRAVTQVTRIIKARAEKMVLLEMVMPNGKPLGECTGQDCAIVGGWLSKIATKIKPHEIVGEKLSEMEVRRLFR